MKTKHEGHEAVNNAIVALSVISWAAIIIGAGLSIMAIALKGPVGIMLSICGAGILGLITRSILKGFASVVKACEHYLKKEEEAGE